MEFGIWLESRREHFARRRGSHGRTQSGEERKRSGLPPGVHNRHVEGFEIDMERNLLRCPRD